MFMPVFLHVQDRIVQYQDHERDSWTIQYIFKIVPIEPIERETSHALLIVQSI